MSGRPAAEPERAGVGVVVGGHDRPVAGEGGGEEGLVVEAEQRHRQQDLEIAVEGEEGLEEHRLGPEAGPLGGEDVLLGRVGDVVGEVDVVTVDDHPGGEAGHHLEVEVGNVAVELHHVGRVDEQHVAGAERGEELRFDVLHRPLDDLDRRQRGDRRPGVGIDAGQGAGDAVAAVGGGGQVGVIGGEPGADLDEPPRLELTEHQVEHQRIDLGEARPVAHLLGGPEIGQCGNFLGAARHQPGEAIPHRRQIDADPHQLAGPVPAPGVALEVGAQRQRRVVVAAAGDVEPAGLGGP